MCEYVNVHVHAFKSSIGLVKFQLSHDRLTVPPSYVKIVYARQNAVNEYNSGCTISRVHVHVLD